MWLFIVCFSSSYSFFSWTVSSISFLWSLPICSCSICWCIVIGSCGGFFMWVSLIDWIFSQTVVIFGLLAGSQSRHSSTNGFNATPAPVIWFRCFWRRSVSNNPTIVLVLESYLLSPSGVGQHWLNVWRTIPANEKTSMEVSYFGDDMVASGGIKSTVPGALVFVFLLSAFIALATPKSLIFATCWAVNKTLFGDKSRCTMGSSWLWR